MELTIECDGASTAAKLNDVLMPDNRYFPSDQVFGAKLQGGSLKFSISSPRARPALSTVSSILSDTKLFCQITDEVLVTKPQPV